MAGGRGLESADSAIMAEVELARERVDLFKDVKPYYGKAAWDELRDKVPTLFSVCMRVVVKQKLDSEAVPTVLKSKLNHWRHFQDYRGPRVLKCSRCFKYYTKQNKFADHECT